MVVGKFMIWKLCGKLQEIEWILTFHKSVFHTMETVWQIHESMAISIPSDTIEFSKSIVEIFFFNILSSMLAMLKNVLVQELYMKYSKFKIHCVKFCL